MPTPRTQEAVEVAAIIDQLPRETREYLREMVIRVAGILPTGPAPEAPLPSNVIPLNPRQ